MKLSSRIPAPARSPDRPDDLKTYPMKPSTQFKGGWRITWMEVWDQDFVDLVEPGHFSFDGESGQFVFGTVEGSLDARYPDGGQRVEFTWAGSCEGDEMSGRGWFALKEAYVAEGHIFIHEGDDSALMLEKETKSG